MIVCDEDGRRFGAPQQRMQVLAHPAGHIGVQIAEGLIQQEDDGILHERAGEGDTLLLPAGQFMRIAAIKSLKTRECEHFLNLALSVAS